MISFRISLVVLASALLSACASVGSPPLTHQTSKRDAAPAPVLILVSIDGLRADALNRGVTPHLDRLATTGVHAEGMTPSYPALTFPNHYTLVTGLYPDHHGIIHNTMSEDALGTFRLNDRKVITRSDWWGGEPIWVGAEKAGIATATWSWPGSEAVIHGIQPRYWRAYDEKVPATARIQQALDWLATDASSPQPRFVALYLEQVDKAGHSYGPDSPQYQAALRDSDAAVGQLVEGLRQRNQLEKINLIVVSDHGMATVKDGQQVAIEDMVPPDLAKPVSVGQSVGFAPLPGKQAQAEARLLGSHENYDCWKRENLPPRWRYGTHPRVPAIICQMHEGWDALPATVIVKRWDGDRGSHGYDPALPSMQALFLAHGPSFKQGSHLPRFDNVDLYPLLARLIGIEPAPNDGNPATLLPALR